MLIEISIGEGLDRYSILEIKQKEITEPLLREALLNSKNETSEINLKNIIDTCITHLDNKQYAALALSMLNLGEQTAFAKIDHKKIGKDTYAGRIVKNISQSEGVKGKNAEQTEKTKSDAEYYLKTYADHRKDFVSDAEFWRSYTKRGESPDKYRKLVERYFEAELKELKKKLKK